MLYYENDVERLEFVELEKDRTTRAVRRKRTAHKKNHKANAFKAKYHERLPKNGKPKKGVYFNADEYEDACHIYDKKAKRLRKAIMHDAFDHGTCYSMPFGEWLETEIGITWGQFDCLYSPDQQNNMFDWYEYECRYVW